MFTEDKLSALEAKLEEMAKQEPPRKKITSKKDLFVEYNEQITKLLAAGWSESDIAKALSDVGIKISVATIKQYVREINGAPKKRTAKSKKATNKVEEVASSNTVEVKTDDAFNTNDF